MIEVKDLKEFIQAIGPVFTVLSTLAAVWLTQKGNRTTQKNLLEQQIIRDEIKEKRNELKETLEVYNKILKVDGESTVVIDEDGKLREFDFNIYQEEVRPILYEKYHLLHDEVAKIVACIDLDIKRCKLFGEAEDSDHYGLCKDYDNLIRNIRKNIYDFRKEGSREEMS
ncbi:hypothetical protein [Bacillus cereus]|uniref:Phage protein n=1 Tax=Bacillus cereus (strain ATCC 14579 / DSM 31 / CCUG 7414 / JCM 2152 / NBRC 15305 / NCIMB 9373 / NCTC 2599 / NRRL B-3711) TaxID=226900 RepID=Q81D00_BACCR|nr:hypothetical protein [Bacillus cereus]NP_852589.1 hypothetical protein BC2584 [Bacillus phage phBC6A52]AAP09543.1 Phage protein [Bacillus cereus ATCC 14579]